jgi:ABC-type branched-subunit amino acid transport system substrate-binding protein
MRMTTRGAGLAAAALSLVLAVSACGGAGEDDDAGGGKAGAPGNTAGFDGKTIKLGVITPLSGPVAVIGKPLTSGNEVWFEALNAKGGIGGKYKVELVEEDSQYKTDVAVQKYNKIKGDVVSFAQVLGTPSTLAVLPQLRTDKMLAAPASLDAFWVREENLLPVGGPYQVQAINAVDYYLTDGGGSKDDVICTMIQDDVYGEAGQQGIDFAAEKYGFSVANTQKFKQGTENYAGQIGALAGAKCQMVFLVATPSDAAKIWGTAAQARFAPQWFGQSPSYTGALSQSAIAPYMQQSVLIVAEGTEWGDESVPGMKAMVDGAAKYAPDEKPDYYFAFGYNQARAMTAVLEKAVENGDLSREGVLKASTEIGTVNFEGLSGDYKYGPAEERNPPRASTIFKVDPAKPFGLAKVKYLLESDAAKEFEFKKADL